MTDVQDRGSKVWSQMRGSWLLLVFLALYGAALKTSLVWGQRLAVHDRPGVDPPWYFIRTAFAQGACLTIVGFAGVLLGAATLRRYPIWAPMIIGNSVIWCGGAAWKAMVILFRTSHMFDPEGAATSWPSFTAYMADGPIRIGSIVAPVLGAACWLWLALKRRRRAA